jgi:hypothetical protein
VEETENRQGSYLPLTGISEMYNNLGFTVGSGCNLIHKPLLFIFIADPSGRVV